MNTKHWILIFSHLDGHISHVESDMFLESISAAQQDLDICTIHVFSQTPFRKRNPKYHNTLVRTESQLWDIG